MRTFRALIGAFVLFAMAGAFLNSRGGASASPEPVAVDAATAVPTSTPAHVPPPPAPRTLLTLKGSGIKNSKPFSASGDSLDLAYAFDCKAYGGSGNFQVYVVDADGSPNVAVNELAKSGKDTTTVYLSDGGSPYHLEMNSECSWTVTVTGVP